MLTKWQGAHVRKCEGAGAKGRAGCYKTGVASITRRAFVTSMAAFAALPVVRGQGLSARVDGSALRRRLEELSVFGRPAGGTFASGVSRVAYSDADVQGRAYV